MMHHSFIPDTNFVQSTNYGRISEGLWRISNLAFVLEGINERNDSVE